MLSKSLFVISMLPLFLQLNAAEEKFQSAQLLIRHGAGEFTKATYGSIEKGFAVAEDIVKELKAVEPKSDADKTALEKLEKYVELAEKSKGTPVTDENIEDKLELVLRTLFLLGSYKTKEGESLQNSQAAKDILKKFDLKSQRESFFKDFNIFAEKFLKEVEDFLTYTEGEGRQNFDEWSKKFKAETDNVQKLHQFLELFVNVGQFGDL